MGTWLAALRNERSRTTSATRPGTVSSSWAWRPPSTMRSGLNRLTSPARPAPSRSATRSAAAQARRVGGRGSEHPAGGRLDVTPGPASRGRQHRHRVGLHVEAATAPAVAAASSGIDGQVADLERVPGAAGVEAPGRHERAPDTPLPRREEEHVGGTGTGPVAVLGQRGQVGVVADVDPTDGEPTQQLDHPVPHGHGRGPAQVERREGVLVLARDRRRHGHADSDARAARSTRGWRARHEPRQGARDRASSAAGGDARSGR